MRILIIEDELPAAERLQRILEEVDPAIEIAGITTSIRNSIEWLQQNKPPEIIFLDIELSDGQSFKIFEQLQITALVIFTTSYDEYALKAFELNSIDYLLKPIRKADLESSLQKYKALKTVFSAPAQQAGIKALLESHNSVSANTYRTHFIVKKGQQHIPIDLKSICYFYADKRLCFLMTWQNSKYIIDHTMEEIAGMIDPEEFYRVNRSFIIHRRSVITFRRSLNGKLDLSLSLPLKNAITVSKEKAGDFKKWLSQ